MAENATNKTKAWQSRGASKSPGNPLAGQQKSDHQWPSCPPYPAISFQVTRVAWPSPAPPRAPRSSRLHLSRPRPVQLGLPLHHGKLNVETYVGPPHPLCTYKVPRTLHERLTVSCALTVPLARIDTSHNFNLCCPGASSLPFDCSTRDSVALRVRTRSLGAWRITTSRAATRGSGRRPPTTRSRMSSGSRKAAITLLAEDMVIRSFSPAPVKARGMGEVFKVPRIRRLAMATLIPAWEVRSLRMALRGRALRTTSRRASSPSLVLTGRQGMAMTGRIRHWEGRTRAPTAPVIRLRRNTTTRRGRTHRPFRVEMDGALKIHRARMVLRRTD